MRKVVIGVMGPGNPEDDKTLELAHSLGEKIAQNGWVLLTGGRNSGVMDKASQGATEASGLVIGVLPGADYDNCSSFVDVAIPTGMGSARNNINILASDVVVAVGIGAGTASEVSLAIKAGKPVILLNAGREATKFFLQIGKDLVKNSESVQSTIDQIKTLIK